MYPYRGSTDPSEMAMRFSEEDAMSHLDSIFTEPDSEMEDHLDRVRAVLDELPPSEYDFIDLYYFKRLKQTDIAAIFQVSQPTVCYRLQRASMRIRVLLSMKNTGVEVDEAVMAAANLLHDPLDGKIMELLMETACQSQTATMLNVSQGLVRHRYVRAIKKMTTTPGYKNYGEFFDIFGRSLSLIREMRKTSGEPQECCIV